MILKNISKCIHIKRLISNERIKSTALIKNRFYECIQYIILHEGGRDRCMSSKNIKAQVRYRRLYGSDLSGNNTKGAAKRRDARCRRLDKYLALRIGASVTATRSIYERFHPPLAAVASGKRRRPQHSKVCILHMYKHLRTNFNKAI